MKEGIPFPRPLVAGPPSCLLGDWNIPRKWNTAKVYLAVSASVVVLVVVAFLAWVLWNTKKGWIMILHIGSASID
jgi:hypothetical protein